jgi:chromate transporter
MPSELPLARAGVVVGKRAAAETPPRVAPLVLGKIFLRIGATSFGGLGSALAIIEREFVDRRRVLTAEDITEATAATRLLPGSTVTQVTSFLGYRLGGWVGSGVATVAFVLPSVAAMFLLAVFYDSVSGLSALEPAAQGLTAAVVGLLLATAYRFGRAMISGPVTLAIALAAFGSAAGLGIPAVVIVGVAGIIGIPLHSAPEASQGSASKKEGG